MSVVFDRCLAISDVRKINWDISTRQMFALQGAFFSFFPIHMMKNQERSF